MAKPLAYTDMQLLYAATSRCRCGAGLAYPPDTPHPHGHRFWGSWDCSRVLKGEPDPAGFEGKHESFPWAMYKVREETSVNNAGGYTTRPAGTVALTVGTATCGKCAHTWESAPYNASVQRRHWQTGPCPACGNATGADGSHQSGDGPRIEARFADAIFAADAVPTSLAPPGVDPATREAYDAKAKANTKMSGFGLDTAMHMPCPFCAAPDFLVYRIVDVETALSAPRVCATCKRGSKAVFTRGAGGVSFEFVQTEGPDGPAYLPPMRRVS